MKQKEVPHVVIDPRVSEIVQVGTSKRAACWMDLLSCITYLLDWIFFGGFSALIAEGL